MVEVLKFHFDWVVLTNGIAQGHIFDLACDCHRLIVTFFGCGLNEVSLLCVVVVLASGFRSDDNIVAPFRTGDVMPVVPSIIVWMPGIKLHFDPASREVAPNFLEVVRVDCL